MIRLLLLALLCIAPSLPARAAEVAVAVAANFTAPMRVIARAFEAQTGHRVVLAFGSTGGFEAQIRNGAPFDLLLAADQVTPARLEGDGLAVAGSRFTYATGRLVLWSRLADQVDAQGMVLRTGTFERIAIANPKLAPYGAAALDVMTRLGVLERLRPRIVQGENIAQAHQFVATGNAAMGFVALSQVWSDGRIGQGSGWIVPESLHAPIRQDAVLLARGARNPAAPALLEWLRGDAARAVIRGHGYAH
jgi:molybdate transport system substrate-binding protein